ncbi:MAG: Gfo/Idh/MocA family oxidoreductase [Lachnospiraceae bacterium]|nr:Gfo/Idh/MocA family oxidoreductase [Lachnospiraceae bacterium]
MKKVGIIGCGNIAKVHGWVLQAMDDVELVAVCDVREEKAKEFSKVHTDGKAEVFTDWLTMSHFGLDVVHICTPHYLHAPMAVELLRQGKAVFMEKPCAISREQFEVLKMADKQYQGKLGFCFQNRYNETTEALDRMVAQGLVGKVKGARAFVTWRRDEEYYAGSDWKGKWATEGGGALINQSIHTLDLLLRYLGNPKEVKSSMRNHHLQEWIEVEDTVEAWISFEDDIRACFYASNGYASDAPVILELQGEKGRITMNGALITLWTEENGYQYFVYEKKEGISKGYWGCGHEACIRDFYGCLERKERFEVDIQGVENTFEVMMKIYEEGERVWNR